MTETVRLIVSRRFDASPERVFDAWLDPKMASRFLFATATGRMVQAEIEARVGGRFLFVDRRPDAGDVRHEGKYLEIDRPRRLAFTFAVPQYDPAATTVTLDFAAAGAGCELTLTHAGVPPQWAEQTRQGWGTILEGLAGVV